MISAERFILGIWMMLGVFALKAGIGLFLSCQAKKGIQGRMRMFALYLLTYLCVFSILGFIWINDRTTGTLARILINFGQEIHLLVSFSLIMLGYYFLIKDQDETNSKAWVSLLFPCPVCISTIFLTLGFALRYFPNSNLLIILGSYSGFVFLSLIAFLGTRLIENYKGIFNHSHVVGGILILSSLYTMLTLLFSNGIMQAKNIMGMTAKKFSVGVSSNQITFAIIGVFFIVFFFGYLKSRRFFISYEKGQK